MHLTDLPPSYPATRDQLQLVATHVLARRRHQVTGRFGLRATPGGLGTPVFGPDDEVLRLAGDRLVRERRTQAGPRAVSVPLTGSTLRILAAHADADLDAELSVGHDTPPLGDPDAPLDIDPAATGALAAWVDLGWQALDTASATLPGLPDAAVVQLWPEHFDAGTDVAAGGGRVNLGASPGDGFHPDPYLYVGPWGPERPGDPVYWNAPFGAVLGYQELQAADDPLRAAADFLRRGVRLLHTG
jgi:hypothetical protein